MKKLPHISTLRNILILRAEGALGDAIRSSCCYRAIKQANPNIKITVGCFGTNVQYLSANPYIDTLIKLPIRRHIRGNQRWLSLILTALKLRRHKFDLVLDTSNMDHYNWHFFKWIIGTNRVLDKFTCPITPFGSPNEHMAKHKLAIVKLLGVQSDDWSYDLPTPPQTRQSIDLWLTQHKLAQYILLNPTGSTVQKRFTPLTLTQLVTQIKALGFPIIILTEPQFYTYWKNSISEDTTLFLKQTNSIFEAFELLRRAALVITPDTALLHAATGFERPTIAFYNEYCPQNDPANPNCKIIKTNPNDINDFDWNSFKDILIQTKI
ncbi:MAG: glycosyltransferase family 9 protein [Elusimicrobiaceae bacterium]|nr:glycosyltransferase family 9 protein [Elusimicrobiaceae bacterium]